MGFDKVEDLFISDVSAVTARYRDEFPVTKELIYLAVSASNQCPYCIASHTASARKAGMSDAIFAELMAVVGMANETNRLSSGYQVEIDERFKTTAPAAGK